MPTHRTLNRPSRDRQHFRLGLAGTERRERYIRRIESTPDAEARWALLLARPGQQLDIDREIDQALDAVADVAPSALALLKVSE
jgi:hypothetical protein